ncbi:hypothetical protein GGS21DRAFT_489924 [Xylaria nigripes]|nr:hypothetical protein GGS21DRAFT_489924 [Xylaria nigripes]
MDLNTLNAPDVPDVLNTPNIFSPPSLARLGPFASVYRFIPSVGTDIVIMRPLEPGAALPSSISITNNVQPHKQKRAPILNPDQRQEIKTLHNKAGWTYMQLVGLGYTHNQVQKVCTQPLTPKTRKGKPDIETPNRNRIKQWLEASATHCRMTWSYLPAPILDLPYFGKTAISLRAALESRTVHSNKRIGKLKKRHPTYCTYAMDMD